MKESLDFSDKRHAQLKFLELQELTGLLQLMPKWEKTN